MTLKPLCIYVYEILRFFKTNPIGVCVQSIFSVVSSYYFGRPSYLLASVNNSGFRYSCYQTPSKSKVTYSDVVIFRGFCSR